MQKFLVRYCFITSECLLLVWLSQRYSKTPTFKYHEELDRCTQRLRHINSWLQLLQEIKQDSTVFIWLLKTHCIGTCTLQQLHVDYQHPVISAAAEPSKLWMNNKTCPWPTGKDGCFPLVLSLCSPSLHRVHGWSWHWACKLSLLVAYACKWV